MLKELSFEYELIQRVIFEFLLKNKLHVHYSDVDFIQPKLVMDLLWYLDDDKVELELVKEPLARAIFSAKGLGIEDEKSDIFELEVLQKLHVLGYEKATLNFSYICTSCKHSLPAFFYRCPSCHELGKITIEPILSRVSQHSDMVF